MLSLRKARILVSSAADPPKDNTVAEGREIMYQKSTVQVHLHDGATLGSVRI